MKPNDPKFVEFPIRDIPKSLGKNLLNNVLRHYTVPLSQIRSGRNGTQRSFAGTGTLVSHLDNKYILTAYHVWDKRLADSDYVGVFVKPHADLHWIDRKFIQPIMVGRYGSQPEEWGPDLAFLPLDPRTISCIQASKSFYNLARRKDKALSTNPPRNVGLWFVVGVPAVLNQITEKGICLAIRAYGSVLLQTKTVNGFDYYDFSVDHEDRPNIPASFEGLSGGGLWHVDLNRSRSTGVISTRGNPTLDGVIYYQNLQSRGRGYIRCHGRCSIYDKALSSFV